MKAVDQSKDQILEEAGYAYSLDRMMYVNRQTKKVFGVEFVEDHSEDQLQRCINEHSGGGAWRFYVNSPLLESVRRELESLLNHG
jgi:hypothetical protein